ncbi:uncharacterized protein LOC110983278 isoform X2 [Acanthaster planci]|nr:uncharacterized protein LOC110983278 isoform X2 [Acanthaster planci]XP_022098102.1 uncharacterized protein LOC110983278 isoform X2 [Acanthaster planci]
MAPIDVTILKVKDPSHFWAKEVPGPNSSIQAAEFVQLSEEIKEYCKHEQFLNMHTYNPKKGEVYLVRKMDGDQWYRARVTSIIQRKHLAEASCFLLDFGETIKLPTNRLRDIPPHFLKLPFQAREYCLYGIVPLSLKVSFDEDKATMQPAAKWDTAAVEYFDELLIGKSAKVDIHRAREDGVSLVTLFVSIDQQQMNVNEDLLRLNFCARIEEPLAVEVTAPRTPEGRPSSGASESSTPPARSPTSLSPKSADKTEGAAARRKPINAAMSLSAEARDGKTKLTLRDYFGLPPLKQDQLKTHATLSTTSTRSLEEDTPSQQMESSVPLVKGTHPNQSSGKLSFAGRELASKSSVQNLPVSSGRNLDSPSVTSTVSSVLKTTEGSPQQTSPSWGDADKLRSSVSSTREVLARLQAIKERSKNLGASQEQPAALRSVQDGCRHTASDKPRHELLQPASRSPQETHQQTTPITPSASLNTKQLPADAPRPKSKSSSPVKNLLTTASGATRLPFAVDGRFTLSAEELEVRAVTPPKTLPSPARQELRKSRPGETSSDPDCYSSSSDEPNQHMPSVMPQSKVIGQRLLKQISLASDQSPASDLQEGLYSHIKKTSGILVHGDRPPRPMISVEQAPFPDSIRKKLSQLGFPSPSDIQAYSWPIILRGTDMVGVSAPRTGKSLAFLLPLITQSLQPSTYSSLPPGNGPLVIIVCPRWRKAAEVYDQCCKFLPTQRGSKVILIHGAGSEEQQEVQLLNGCSILVATLPCLLRMLQDDHTSLNRLSHLVLDDADILCEDFTDKVKELMSEYATVLSRPNSQRTAPRQLLLFSSHWTMGLGSFVRAYMADPVVVIASTLEAAVYARVGQVVLRQEPSERDGFLRGLLDSDSPTQARRTVIFANTKDQAKHLQEVLLGGFSQYALLAFRGMPQHHLESVKEEWCAHQRSNSQLILVCTDNVIQELGITSANTVVHYDFPPSKQKFGLRLSCMTDHYASQLEEAKVSDCRSILLISKDDTALIPGLANLLKRCSFAIPTQLNLDAAVQEKEESKKWKPLCHQLKAFGECGNGSSCVGRHEMFADVDTPGCNAKHIPLPSAGIAKILVTHVVNATNFYARLLEHRSTEASNPVALPTTHLDLAFEMASWFSDPAHRVSCDSPVASDLCGLEDGCHVFHRVRVQRSKRGGSALFEEEKEVQFVDQGRIERVPVNKLLKLPDHLHSKPYQAVEIYVCRVKPVDGDTEWTTQAGFFVHDKIHDKQLEGKITLSLGNVLWLDPVVQRVHLPSIKTTVNAHNVRQELLQEGFAVDNPEHITKLRKKCEGKVVLPDMVMPSALEQRSQPMLLPDPIYLSPSDDYYLVYVSSVHTPGCLYLQLTKFSERLDKLMEEINAKLSDKKAPPLPQDWHPRVGEVCLAKFHEDNRWNRVQIIDVLGDDRYEIFYLDYGDREEVAKDWLHPAWNNILMLPFQAIQCSLTNISPTQDPWSDAAGDALWDMCLEGDNKKLLMAKIISEVGSESESRQVGSSAYEIELYDTSSERDVVIGQELVHAGHAVGNEAFLQNMFPTAAVDDATEPPLSTEIGNMLSHLCLQLYLTKNEYDQLEVASQINELITTLSQSECSTEVDVTPLCRLVASGRCKRATESLAASLALVCFKSAKNCEMMCRCGGLKELCELLLKTEDVSLQEYISYILMLSSGNQRSIREYGGINALCRILETPATVDILNQASAALAALVADNSKNQCAVNEAGGLGTVCRLLSTMKNEDCHMNLLRALSKMAANGGTRDMIREEGGLLTLCDLLWDTMDSPTVHLLVQALASLSCNNPRNLEVMADLALMDCVEGQLMCMSHSETTHRLLVTLHIRLIEHSKTQTDQSDYIYQPGNQSGCTASQLTTGAATTANLSGPTPSPNHKPQPVSKVISIEEVTETRKKLEVEKDDDALADMPPLEIDAAHVLPKVHPKVLWSQRSNSVVLSVQLRGVLTFDLDVTSTSVSFSTILDETNYTFSLDLYSRVRTPEHTAVTLGSEVLITLYKETVGTSWSRLTASKAKLAFVGVDFERWTLEDTDSDDDIAQRFGIKKKPPLPHRPKTRPSQSGIPIASVPELDTSESSDSYLEVSDSEEDAEFGFASDHSDTVDQPPSS